MEYLQVLSYCTQFSHYLHNSNHELALEDFKKLWDSIEEPQSLFNENNFQNSVISLNINSCNNTLIHNFLMNEAREFFKSKYEDFRTKTNYSIFIGAISLNNVENIRKFLPESVDSKECLQMSIKYGSYDAYTYFLENHIPKKQHSKIIAWSHREFWAYHHNNYGSSIFFKKLVKHPLSKNKPLKQDIYTMLDNCEFSFIHDLIKSPDTFSLFKEINIEHYYKLLLKNLITKKDNISYEYKEGIQLLITSKQAFSFDFSQVKILPKFKKSHPEIAQLLDKFILKDKLDLLPEKNIIKKHKI